MGFGFRIQQIFGKFNRKRGEIMDKKSIIILLMGAALISTVAAYRNITSDLRAELVATRTAMDSATVLAQNNDGKIFMSREGMLRLPGSQLNSESDETATSIRVTAPKQSMKEFLIFRNGIVVITDYPDSIDLTHPAPPAISRVENWGTFEKWRR
jgi:hypothetical protein